MSLGPQTLCLQRIAMRPYLALPPSHCQVTYIWINSSGTEPMSKTRIMQNEPESLEEVPVWRGVHSRELSLVPVAIFRDPFIRGPHKMVLCDARNRDGTPATGSRREECLRVMEAVKDQKPWFGFEQEFVLKTLEGLPFGWSSATAPPAGASAQVGLERVFGRDISLSHYNACVYAGIKMAGAAGEAMPAQWEFQVGPSEGIALGDHAWMARYILLRVCEDFGLVPIFSAKPVEGSRWANGGHMNFSTESMREEGGLRCIHEAIERLSQRHTQHMALYGGPENQQRLNTIGINSDFNTFSWATANRKSSVRVPGHVSQRGQGYLEDRRPAADCDPYLVCKALVQTCCPVPGLYGPGPDLLQPRSQDLISSV
ncbi:unnamed protein product [Knipowitschia caucasica]